METLNMKDQRLTCVVHTCCPVFGRVPRYLYIVRRAVPFNVFINDCEKNRSWLLIAHSNYFLHHHWRVVIHILQLNYESTGASRRDLIC